MKNPICFALDVPDAHSAQWLVDRLEDHVGAFKVGLELFIASGTLPITKNPIVLDLKLHDIPETVVRATRAAGNRGVKYLTIHTQQLDTLKAAQEEAKEYNMTLLGVTVLTSMTEADFEPLGLRPSSVRYRAISHARFAVCGAGIRGLVCSPQEIKSLRENFAPEEQPFLLVPGIRPAGAATNDQKRVGTPKQAVSDGADLIVIGRPIRDAPDPARAAYDILQEIYDES